MIREVTVYVDPKDQEDKNDQWINRFEIKSESSNRVYVISQHRTKRHWACSCPGYRAHRKCKHLQRIGLPCYEQPYEPIIAHK